MAAHVHRFVQYGTIPGGRSLVLEHLVGKVERLGDGEGGSLGLSRGLTNVKESGKEFLSGKKLSRDLTKMKESGKVFVSGKKLASGKNVCEVKISPSSSCV